MPFTPEKKFLSPAEILPGTVVVDRDTDMVAVAQQVTGLEVTVARPSGLTWQTGYLRLRPGNFRDARQLHALAALYQKQSGIPGVPNKWMSR
ncbi:hypothetical protein [Streptomyces sp. NPDC002067]